MSKTYLVVNPHGAGGTRDKKFAKWYNEIDPDIGLISELGKNREELAKTHTVFGAMNSHKMVDPAIVVREGQTRLSGGTTMLTRDMGESYAPDRWVCQENFHGRHIFTTHANAVIQDERGQYRDNKSAGAWYHGMQHLNRMLYFAGNNIILGGDLNWRHHPGRKPVYRSPEWIARLRNLDFICEQVMWFMWSKHDFKLISHEVIPGKEVPVGINEEKPHPALLVTLKRIKKPR